MDLGRFIDAIIGPGEFIAPIWIALFIAIGFVIWKLRKPGVGFWRWLTPREIYRHRSHMLDIKLFMVSRVLILSGLVSRLVLTPTVALAVAGENSGLGYDLHAVALAAVFFITLDFTQYWQHRAYHQIGLIWPIHAVHHSAEVMTPLTAYRQHPLSYPLSALIQSSVLGVILGVILGAAAPDTTFATLFGINVFLVASYAALANFRHSHVWIGFGPVVERLLISPAQHQIHHSTKPEHHGRNFGETLAIWDWLFGTLYVTHGAEDVRFGLDGPDDSALSSHRLGAALWNPLRRMAGRG